jgi:hypothetical protein
LTPSTGGLPQPAVFYFGENYVHSGDLQEIEAERTQAQTAQKQ